MIKNVIFDLGAVLMNIDYNLTTNAFKELGYHDFENMYSQFKANKIFDSLEMGTITEESFYKYLLDAAIEPITKAQLTKAWNAMLIDFRADSFQFLEQLKNTHQLFLLSNTNSIHMFAFDEIFKKQMKGKSIRQYFTKAYFSNEIGLRKPNEDIFNFVLQDAALKADETFFIDDLYANIETANKLGFKTHQLLPGEKIELLQYE